MPKLVISTVGTSLLTNQIDNFDPENWLKRLQKTANDQNDSIQTNHPDVAEMLAELESRARETLFNDDKEISQIREASAELNGIYGLYQQKLSQGKTDVHWLVATDTAQGQVTAKILRDFLNAEGLVVEIYTPNGFSTFSTETFTQGIDEFLQWLDETLPGYQESQYQICFNLVGGFKALQGYANAIGMFYGAEIIYVFEGNFEVITIPRLPIQIDTSAIEPVQFALMAAGAEVKVSKLDGVPETLIFVVDDEATLSNWGRLIWNSHKSKFLSGDLLDFPRIEYQESFRADYNQVKVEKERVKLQEALALVSYLLEESQGDTSILKKPGLKMQYDKYVNMGDMAHFRINRGLRVSCTSFHGTLLLHRYGKEPDVNKNPW